MRNIRLTLAYDGTGYVGWQIQPNGVSVQSVVEAALREFCGTKSSLIAAGRTDAGVHALGQVANFRTESAIPCRGFAPVCRRFCPDDILVRRRRRSPARLSRHLRRQAEALSLRDSKRAGGASLSCGITPTSFTLRLDERAMHAAAQVLVGTHDFCALRDAASQHGQQRADGLRGDRRPLRRLARLECRPPMRRDQLRAGYGGRIRLVRHRRRRLSVQHGPHDCRHVDPRRRAQMGRGRRPPHPRAGHAPQAGPTAPACGLYLWCRVEYRARHAREIPRRPFHHAADHRRRAGEHAADGRRSASAVRRRGDAHLRPGARSGGNARRAGPKRRPRPADRSRAATQHPSLARLASYRRLLTLLREIQPQIVHTHSSKAGILGRLAASRLGIPAVHTIHGAAFHYGQNPLAHQATSPPRNGPPRTAGGSSACATP